MVGEGIENRCSGRAILPPLLRLLRGGILMSWTEKAVKCAKSFHVTARLYGRLVSGDAIMVC